MSGRTSRTPVIAALMLACLAVPVSANQTLDHPLAVRLNGKEARRAVVIVDLGNITLPHVKKFELQVVNTSDEAAHIALFESGSRIDATWGLPARTNYTPANVGELRPGIPVPLQISFTATPDRPDGLQVLNLTWLGRLVLQIALDYDVFQKETIEWEVPTGQLSSGQGKDYSDWYEVCSGPVPEGYTVDLQKFEIVSSGRERACDKYVECEQLKFTPENGVCHRFRIQGHSELVFGIEEKTSTWAAGRLFMRCQLQRSEPHFSD